MLIPLINDRKVSLLYFIFTNQNLYLYSFAEEKLKRRWFKPCTDIRLVCSLLLDSKHKNHVGGVSFSCKVTDSTLRSARQRKIKLCLYQENCRSHNYSICILHLFAYTTGCLARFWLRKWNFVLGPYRLMIGLTTNEDIKTTKLNNLTRQ